MLSPPISLSVSLSRSIEVHTTVQAVQGSILAKLVLCRCINSALLIYLATAYDATFGEDSLQQMQNILIADAITTPLLRLLNVYDFFMRYVYAPYTSTTQDEYVYCPPRPITMFFDISLLSSSFFLSFEHIIVDLILSGRVQIGL
jgi:hypothetical protein